jgi:hypothetical protein
MSTVRFGTICDICGSGSRDYAHDANFCEDCGRDLCDICASQTAHTLAREADEGHPKEWACPEGVA